MATRKAKKSPKKLKNVRLESLNKKYIPHTRKEFVDYSPEYLRFLKKNHPEEYAYLAQFANEYYGGAVEKTKARIRKDGTKIRGSGRIKKSNLHDTKELAKDCYDRNNRQNNDVLGVTKVNSLVTDINSELRSDDGWYITNPELTEKYILDTIERKRNEEQLLTYEEFLEYQDKLSPEMLLFYLAYFDLE